MRRRTFAMYAVMSLVALQAAGLAHAQKPAKKSADVVKIKAKADKPDASGQQVVTVTLSIDKDWHLYANPVGVDDLASAQTELTISGSDKTETVKIEYPTGKTIKDPLVGNYSVYEGEVTIKATIKRPAGSKGEIEVSVKLQACSESMCLPPGSVKATADNK